MMLLRATFSSLCGKKSLTTKKTVSLGTLLRTTMDPGQFLASLERRFQW